MKIKFLAVGSGNANIITDFLDEYQLLNSMSFDEEVVIHPIPEDLKSLGIRKIFVDAALELHVVVKQKINPMFDCVPVDGVSHNWEESDWIDFADAQEDKCYCIPSTAPEGHEIIWDENRGWTVIMPENEDDS